MVWDVMVCHGRQWMAVPPCKRRKGFPWIHIHLQVDPGDALPSVSEQDVEYIRTAFEKGLVSEGCHSAVLAAREQYLQQSNAAESERELDKGADVWGPLSLSRKGIGNRIGS